MQANTHKLNPQKLSTTEVIARLRLDNETSEPYYRQLIRNLESLIVSGDLSHGLGLPSERDLAIALNLSRTTVKRCYDELRLSGLLNANGRSGTSVNRPQPVTPPLGKLKGFTQEMKEMGLTPSSRLESHEIVTDRTIASVFKRPSNAPFLRLVRVRLGDNMPMTREVAWYDLSAAPLLEDWDTSGSIYAFIEDRCNIKLAHAEQTIEAILSTAIETKTFGFEQSEPCLFMKRLTYSLTNQLIEYVEGTFRGDAYVYRVKLDI